MHRFEKKKDSPDSRFKMSFLGISMIVSILVFSISIFLRVIWEGF